MVCQIILSIESSIFHQSVPYLLLVQAKESLLTKWVIKGGPTMVFIALAVIAFFTLTIYHFRQLNRKQFISDKLHQQLKELMAGAQVRSAIALTSQHSSVMARLITHSFPKIDSTRADLGEEAIQDAMADFVSQENRKRMTWVNYLSVVAQISPMLGLLGTVMGMVGAFSVLEVNGSADPSQLAGDISEALLTTLWGLINAIPSILFFYYFKNRYLALMSESVQKAEELIQILQHGVNGERIQNRIPEGFAP